MDQFRVFIKKIKIDAAAYNTEFATTKGNNGYILVIYYRNKYYPINASWEYPKLKEKFKLVEIASTFDSALKLRHNGIEWIGNSRFSLHLERYFPLSQLSC